MLHVIEPEEVPAILKKEVDPASVFLAERAATAILPYTANTLRKARHEGMLASRTAPHFHRFGKSVFYRLDELVAWRDAVPQEAAQ
jgi:hypothetical protein